jgi:hypothetical protein
MTACWVRDDDAGEPFFVRVQRGVPPGEAQLQPPLASKTRNVISNVFHRRILIVAPQALGELGLEVALEDLS